MTKINWLHVTDLHVGQNRHEFLWPDIEHKLLEDIERMQNNREFGPIDLVLFTGDLVFSGGEKQFGDVRRLAENDASTTRSRIRETSYPRTRTKPATVAPLDPSDLNVTLAGLVAQIAEKGEGQKPVLFAVPGNHDLVRKDPVPLAVKLLEPWRNNNDILEEFWKDDASDYRKAVDDAFDNYRKWWAGWRGFQEELKGYQEGLMPGDFCASYCKDGDASGDFTDLSLGILGLNTACLQLTGDDYLGSLVVNERQRHYATGGDYYKWVDSHDVCLLMTHHPPDWLDQKSQSYLSSGIMGASGMALHVCGHLHDSKLHASVTEEAGMACELLWQGKSLFGLEYYGEEKKEDRSHGFSYGQLSVEVQEDTKYVYLQIWPRTIELIDDRWRVRIDQNNPFLADGESSTKRFLVASLRIEPPPPPPPPQITAAPDESGSVATVPLQVESGATLVGDVSHHFVSYSSVDGKNFVDKLCNVLTHGEPHFEVWRDRKSRMGGMAWHGKVREAIKSCESLLFVVTRDSVEFVSECTTEWLAAQSYWKTVTLLQLHADAVIPLPLMNCPVISVSEDLREEEVEAIRNRLLLLRSPEGKLEQLEYRLLGLQHEARRTDDPAQRDRIEEDIEVVRREMERWQRIVSDPVGTVKAADEKIQQGMDEERAREKPCEPPTPSRVVNRPPEGIIRHFQDRGRVIKRLKDFLDNEDLTLFAVLGKSGLGKTAVACQFLEIVGTDEPPTEEAGPENAVATVYLGGNGSGTGRVSLAGLVAGLCSLLPDRGGPQLTAALRNSHLSVEDKTQALLAAFRERTAVVLLDNLDNLIDAENGQLQDRGLASALKTLLDDPTHRIKVIVTARCAPGEILDYQSTRQGRYTLRKGLPRAEAKKLLRELDAEEPVGLDTASDALLDKAYDLTDGSPKALKALFSILAADRNTTLETIVSGAKSVLPDKLVDALAGEAFSRLDESARQVVQALAIYGRPVPPVAVDYLLQPYLPGLDSRPVLERLVKLHLVRQKENHFDLHPVDRDYACSQIALGSVEDRRTADAPFTKMALWHRGAQYFCETRLPRERWQCIGDLEPQLAEFELRMRAEEFDEAAGVLSDISFQCLLVWGYYNLVVELHGRLRNKITDPKLRQQSLVYLGDASRHVGRISDAERFFDTALRLAKSHKEIKEGPCLDGLGLCAGSAGRTGQAMDYFWQALLKHREENDRFGEAASLGNLARCYHSSGETDVAIGFLKRSLSLAREHNKRLIEGGALGQLGECYKDLGMGDEAMSYLTQALRVADSQNDRPAKTYFLYSMAMTHIVCGEGDFDEARRRARESLEVARQIPNPIACRRAIIALATAQLLSGDLDDAAATVGMASECDLPGPKPGLEVLRGIISLRRSRALDAEEFFLETLRQGDDELENTSCPRSALHWKGIAFSGLALLTGGDEPKEIGQAIAAHRHAFALSSDESGVGRVLRMYDALAPADRNDTIARVRAVVEDELSKIRPRKGEVWNTLGAGVTG